ncbi:hypothetical protein [Fulvimarina sp. MAC8]|uniref:hypothetical protein n=1 Tax=Fulvimarina sp. MAC8 TaxID=3162874 RepID=UPI0032EBCB67
MAAANARENGAVLRYEILGFANRVDGDAYEDDDGFEVDGTGPGLLSGLGKTA